MNVVCVGPSISSKGGISQIINMILDHPPSGVKIFTISSYRDGGKTVKLVRFIRAFFCLIWTLAVKEIDLVHVHASSHGSFNRKLAFCMVSFIFNKKYVLHIHSGAFIDYFKSSSRFTQALIKSAFNRASVVLAISKYMQKEISENFPLSNVFFLGNAHNLPVPKEISPISKLSNKIVLFIGRISKEKGFLDACLAVKNLLNLDGSYRFMVAGEAVDKEIFFEKSVVEISRNIEYLGWISGDEKVNVLTQATVVLCPSYFEAFGLSALEASAFGTPVIAYDVGGLSDIVADQVTGALVEKGDIHGLSESLIGIVSNESVYCMASESAFETCSTRFSAKNFSSELGRVYSRI